MSFLYTVHPPSPALRPFVHSYTRFARAEPGEEIRGPVLAEGDPLVDRVFACAYAFLSFNLGDPFPPADGRGPIKERSHAAGPITRPGSMPVAGRVELLGVTFRPGWAPYFLQTPADELTDQMLDLDHFWGRSSRELEDRLLEARTLRERIRLVEAELLRRLAADPPADGTVAALADHVVRRGGTLTVDQLRAAAGFSRQHLARKFRQALGVSPKLFCRLVRFQNAMDRIATGPGAWAGAAIDLGYYDQAHLIAEFKEFTGYTPTGFLARQDTEPRP